MAPRMVPDRVAFVEGRPGRARAGRPDDDLGRGPGLGAAASTGRLLAPGAGAADGVLPPMFENAVANDPVVLGNLVDGHGGDLPALVATGRRRADQLRLLLARLDAHEREVVVHARLRRDRELRVDDDLPWGRLAIAVQAGRHLPGHAEQLRSLRSA